VCVYVAMLYVANWVEASGLERVDRMRVKSGPTRPITHDVSSAERREQLKQIDS